MNIFEKYGSYEAVRQAAENYKKSGDRVTAAGLELQCLEYCRQHNIFEIDDLITHPLYDWKILKVHDPIKNENLLFAKTNDHVKHHWGHGLVFDDRYVVAVSYSECRHATDAEIQAGKRL